jgi:hypothetical protein
LRKQQNAFAGHPKTDEIVSGRHMLIVFQYDYRQLERFIEKRIETASGESWEDIARVLSTLGHWEFEDYRDHDE